MEHHPRLAFGRGRWTTYLLLALPVLGVMAKACTRAEPQALERGGPGGATPEPPALVPTPRPSVDPWATTPGQPEEVLAAGTVRDVRFDATTPHIYLLALEAGQCARLRVEQQDVDVALRVQAPDGQAPVTLDLSDGLLGVERAVFVAKTHGVYRILVRPPSRLPGGSYRLVVESVQTASENDARQALALALTAAADEHLASQETRRIREALALYERAGVAWKALGDEDAGIRILRQRGRAHAALYERPRALAVLGQALAGARSRGNQREEACILDAIGPLYRQLGRPADAQAAYYRALSLARGVGDVQLEAEVLNDMGVLAESFSGPDVAAALYAKALPLLRRVGSLRGEAITSYNLAHAYNLLGRTERSEPLLIRSQHLHEASDDRRGQVMVATERGWARYLADDPAGALKHYDSVTEVARELGDERLIAMLDDRRASALMKLGRLRESEAGYRAALAIWQRGGDQRYMAHTTSSLAMLEQQRGNRPEALRLFDEALSGMEQTGDTDAQAHVLTLRARLLLELGDLRAALRDVEGAIDLQERQREGIGLVSSRATHQAARHAFFELYVDVLMRLEGAEPGRGHALEAFNAAERGRARALRDSLLDARARNSEPTLRARDEELREQIYLEQETGRMLRQRHALDNEIKRHEERLADLQREREELRRPTAAAQRERGAPPKPLRLEEVRELLDADTLMLVYALGETRSFAWLVGPELLEMHVLPPREQIRSLADRLHELLKKSNEPGARVQTGPAAEKLGRILLDPFHGHLGSKRLLIVGDTELQYVPFAVLRVVPSQAPASTRTRVALLDEHELVCVPSGSVLALLRRQAARRVPPPRPAIVFADPVFGSGKEQPKDQGTVQAEAALEGDAQTWLPRLGGAKQEAAYIQTRLPGAVVISGFDATRERLMDEPLHEYRILHLATHGIVDSGNPDLSGIVLSRVDREGRPIDGLLSIHDIERLDLRADLVVLSACETALGQKLSGEGLVGLAQAFLRAGASRVLVSLWRVKDLSTSVLMDRFYDAMASRKLPPAAALREAQRSMAEDPRYAAPVYWAAFVLVGDW